MIIECKFEANSFFNGDPLKVLNELTPESYRQPKRVSKRVSIVGNWRSVPQMKGRFFLIELTAS